MEWMGFPLYYSYQGAPPAPRAGAAHATIYPYGPFTAGDGKVVMMAIQNEREWARFCERFLGRPELADDPDYAGNADRNAHRDALGAIIAGRFEELTGAEAAALLAAVPVAHANVNTMADVWAHPQLAARGRWHEVGTPPGRSRRWPRPASSTRRRGWTRCRPSASTPGRSSPSWDSPRPRSTR